MIKVFNIITRVFNILSLFFSMILFFRGLLILLGNKFFIFWPVPPKYHFEFYFYPVIFIIIILTVLLILKKIELGNYITQIIFYILSLICFFLRARWI